MTSVPQARLVLQDAKIVRKKLEDEVDDREWRLGWVLAVVLLRTVGDVLDKVDGLMDPLVKGASAELYKSWKLGEDGMIFRDFIKRERDSIVHEYQTAMTEGSIPLMVLAAGPNGLEGDGPHWVDENLYRPMGSGKFEGEDGRDVLDLAIDWWDRQLDEVDRRVTEQRGP